MGGAAHYHYVIILLRYRMFCTVDTCYKNTLGSRRICFYNRYKVYSIYENCFPEDGSYIRNVLILQVFLTAILDQFSRHRKMRIDWRIYNKKNKQMKYF